MDKILSYCPICGFEGVFDSYGKSKRENARCPSCTSLERNRGLYLYLKNSFTVSDKGKQKVLHVSPEKSLVNFFRKNNDIDYYPVDINPNHPDIRHVVDVTRMQYPLEFFDYVVCYEVLEEVRYDTDALLEFRRVLKEDGRLFINTPTGRNTTVEFEIDPKEKNVYHIPGKKYRIYGQDFIDRLSRIGFSSECVKFSSLTSDEDKVRYRLLDEDSILMCTKNIP